MIVRMKEEHNIHNWLQRNRNKISKLEGEYKQKGKRLRIIIDEIFQNTNKIERT